MIYWMWLSDSLSHGSCKIKKLLDYYGSAKAIFSADSDSLKKSCELSNYELKRLCNKSLTNQQKNLEICKNKGIEILPFDDKRFPNSLKNIDNPPVCLYFKGELPDFNQIPTISIVGTRKADDYSCRAAWSLSARLALANCLIVSGGAMGIDSASHKGAIDCGGKTVAILPCGIEYDYLKNNEPLRKQISNNGCLISELPPLYPLRKDAFHIRNRLISGISLGTVIVEAGEKSGALITARNAAEQGRDVFVITGKPDDEKYTGSYSLIRDGATPIFKAEDVLLEYINSYGNIIELENSKNYNLVGLYNSLYKCRDFTQTEKEVNKTNLQNADSNKIFLQNNKLTLSKNAEIVYNHIDKDFFTVDDLLLTGLSVSDIFTSFIELELAGLVKTVPGGRYAKNIQGE